MPRTSIRQIVIIILALCVFGLGTHFIPEADTYAAMRDSIPVPDKIDVDHVIAEFTANETALLEEFSLYGYKLNFDIQTVKNGKVTSEYHRVSQISLNESGKQIDKIISMPFPKEEMPIAVTLDDLDNLRGPYQFPFQSARAKLYKFTYLKKESVDKHDLYTFDVKPVAVTAGNRLFLGRIWVDVASLTIVKTVGKFVQSGRQEYPVIETIRTMIDNKFMFPATGTSDDKLAFPGRSERIQVTIKYSDYVKLR